MGADEQRVAGGAVLRRDDGVDLVAVVGEGVGVGLGPLGVALGAKPRTFTGLAGIGDLILTCTGTLSRNHTLGQKIGRGMKLKDILAEMRMVAEGVKTAKSLYNLSRKLDVDMPISEGVYHVLYDDEPPADARARADWLRQRDPAVVTEALRHAATHRSQCISRSQPQIVVSVHFQLQVAHATQILECIVHLERLHDPDCVGSTANG